MNNQSLHQQTNTRNTQPTKFRRPVLGKMQRAMLEAGAVEYDDCFALFYSDVTIVVVDARNAEFEIMTQPSYAEPVIAFNADDWSEWRYFESGAELLDALAEL
jgi:hypothetical protein